MVISNGMKTSQTNNAVIKMNEWLLQWWFSAHPIGLNYAYIIRRKLSLYNGRINEKLVHHGLTLIGEFYSDCGFFLFLKTISCSKISAISMTSENLIVSLAN